MSSLSSSSAGFTKPPAGASPFRNFTGRVSKILDNFGFIEDEVFFQLSMVRPSGQPVKLGDQVFVEAHYSDHLPFNWNALTVHALDANGQLIQPLPQKQQQSSQALAAATVPQSGGGGHKLLDPRCQDPRNQSQPQQQQQSSLPCNTSRGLGSSSGGTFVSEYAVSQHHHQSQAGDSNGQHLQHSRNSSRLPAQGQQPLPSQQSVFEQSLAGPAAPVPQYTSRNNSSITYTSTPGSAFVPTQMPPAPVFPGVDPSLVVGHQAVAAAVAPVPTTGLSSGVMGASRGFPAAAANPLPLPNLAVGQSGSNAGRSSRWEPAGGRSAIPVPVNQTGNGLGNHAAGGGRNNSETGNKAENRRRDRDRDTDRTAGAAAGGKDRFGRDRNLFNDRETRADRGRDRGANSGRSARIERSTESPVSTTGSVLSIAGRPENLPKGEVLKPIVLSHDIRFRYGSKVHVPSDFESLIVNPDFELDLQSIPKPLKYKNVGTNNKSRESKSRKRESEPSDRDAKRLRTENHEKDSPSKSSSTSEKSEEKNDVKEAQKDAHAEEESEKKESVPQKEETPDEKGEAADAMDVDSESADNSRTKTEGEEKSEDASSSKDPPLVEKEARKKTPKYGVKVVLLSLNSMNHVYEQVFGYDFEHKTSSSYSYPLNKQISFLSFRNQNDGYSLLGGKFSPELDGFVPGSDGKQPDLIRAAVRCVKEQANIDLSPCSRWISLATFLYNRNEEFGDDSCYEYSTIFLPDVWSLTQEPLVTSHLTQQPVTDKSADATPDTEVNGLQAEKSGGGISASHAPFLREDESGNISGSSEDGGVPVVVDTGLDDIEPQFNELFNTDTDSGDERKELLDRINDLKVADLRTQLDTRGVKVPRNAKKADLVKLLTQELEKGIAKEAESREKSAAKEPALKPEPVIADEVKADADVVIPEAAKLETEAKPETEVVPQAEQKPEQQDGNKIPDAEKSRESESKPKVETELPAKDASTIEYKGDLSFTVLTLHQALNHHKNDHFELSVTAELLREGLLKHFAIIMASCLKANQVLLSGPQTSENERRKISSTKAPTYTQLAFSYIDDRNHGYVLSEDVLQLLSLSGYTISKRGWNKLLNGCERIFYKTLEPATERLTPTSPVDPLTSTSRAPDSMSDGHVFVKKGVVYDMENLVQQQERFTKAQVELKELQLIIGENVY